MLRALSSISMIACLGAVASGAPIASFPDATYAADAMRSNSSWSSIAMFESAFDRPVMMRSDGPAHQTPTHLRPTKPSDGDQSFGDSSKVPTKTVVIPLPAPAGLAIAGLLLLGTTRRR
jgi:hypothetical protein